MRWAAAALLLWPALAAAAPCDGIGRSVTTEDRAAGPAIATQLDAAHATVLQAWHAGEWVILYVETPTADQAFLFYRGHPARQRYVTLWSGAAATGEEGAIRDWVTANAPGIPPALAVCFANHVMPGIRDR